MFRAASKSSFAISQRLALASAKPRPPTLFRHSSSSSSGGGGGGKFLVTSLVTVTGIVGGTVGYASFDPEFRHVIEETVPGSKDVFDLVLGTGEEPVKKAAEKKQPPPPSKLKVIAPPMPELEKPPQPAKIEAPPPAKKPEVVVEPVVDNSMAVVVGLEMALEEACKDLDAKIKLAVETSKASIEATRHHMALVRNLMDDTEKMDDKKAWNEIFEAATNKSDLLRAADQSLREAKDSVNVTIDRIEAGRKNSAPLDSVTLKSADDKATSAIGDLEKVVSALDSVQKEAKLVDEYRSLVEEGRQQFQKEMEAILPDSKLSLKSSTGGALTEEELNILMTHAYRKVCQLQQELAKSQTVDQRPLRSSEDSVGNDDLQSELDAQRRELEIESHRKLGALRDEMEKEMRTQLRRQAAAHADHINDVLEVQSKELSRLHERALEAVATNERAGYKRELARIKGTLDGLDKALDDKTFMTNAAVESQELWLACLALQKALKGGEARISLEPKVKAIERAVKGSSLFENDELIASLLGSIPKAAKTEGVPAVGEIKARFSKVEEMAKRTALIGEEGGSLVLYGLSYLQSLLVVSPSKTKAVPDKTNEAIDVDALNTFDIVWLARSAMEADDLEQAVKYMNLLKGEPRRQASDWIHSARLHLEMELISEALTSYATAIGAQGVPVTK